MYVTNEKEPLLTAFRYSSAYVSLIFSLTEGLTDGQIHSFDLISLALIS